MKSTGSRESNRLPSDQTASIPVLQTLLYTFNIACLVIFSPHLDHEQLLTISIQCHKHVVMDEDFQSNILKESNTL